MLKKTIIRTIVWSITTTLLVLGLLFYFVGDINKLKGEVERYLKNQMECSIKLGKLEWDLEGINLGVSTTEITLFDKEDNLIFQAGPSRAVWNIFNILIGNYAHFHSIEAADLYLNVHRNKEGKWNIIEIFPPGPQPEADKLKLNNSIVYFVDDYGPDTKEILYKDLNVSSEKSFFTKIRKIDLTTNVGSLARLSFLKVQGKFTETKKFNWKQNEIDLFIRAKNIKLKNWETYLSSHGKISKIDGEFNGFVRIRKEKNKPFIKLKSKTKTKGFFAEFKNKDFAQQIKIPQTGFILDGLIYKKKIIIENFSSKINELEYTLNGEIINWDSALPEINLKLKTNKFNFKNIKPFLPLSLLPASARAKIVPINDDGFVELDINAKGLAIDPKYFGNITLSEFNLTPESGFLSFIHGLEGKLVLNDQILKIENLIIPVQDKKLTIKGEVNSESLVTSFNIIGNELNLRLLQDLLTQVEPTSAILSEIDAYGTLDLNLNVLSKPGTPPEIQGNLKFNNAGLSIFQEDPIEIQKGFGELVLDGSKVAFKTVTGLINNESFYINGDFSLKEDEIINLFIAADHLKIIPYIFKFLSKNLPTSPVAKSISGELSNIKMNITGTLSSPTIYGGIDISNVAFQLPGLKDEINQVFGMLRFEGSELVIEDLNGKLGETEFGIAGYIDKLFSEPVPRFRVVINPLEISSIWDFTKDKLKTTPLSSEIQKIEELSGLASFDIFLHPELVTGNIYFQGCNIKHKQIPYKLNNLSGRIVLGENVLSLFDLTGSINGKSNFSATTTVYNHYSEKPNIQGQIKLDLDLPHLVQNINPKLSQNILIDDIIPTIVDFDITYPIGSFSFYSTLSDMLLFDIKPFISKPTNVSYTFSGNFDIDVERMDIYLHQFNISAEDLSLKTIGSIKNLNSKEPEFMLFINNDGPTRTYMIIKPIIPLKDIRLFGEIDFVSSISGTPSMFAISSNATLKNVKIQPPVKKDTRISFDEGRINLYYDNENGHLDWKIKEINYLSFHGKELSLLLNYKRPELYLNKFSAETDTGSIFAIGSYNLDNGKTKIIANGTNLELSKLGSFVLLDPKRLDGITDFSFMIETQGKTNQEIISNLNGEITAQVKNGHIGEVELLHKGLKLANLFGQGLFGFNVRNIFTLFFNYQDGDFNLIDGLIKIKNGVVKAKKLHYRAENLYLNAFGYIDLPKSFIELRFFGFLPDQAKLEETQIKQGAITILPQTLEKSRIVIPFISSTPPQHFKFEIKGDLKNQKRLTTKTRRSFRWLRGRRLEKYKEYIPK